MRTRVTSAVLFAAAVLSLAACSDDDKTEAGATPTTATSASAQAPAGATAEPANTPPSVGAVPKGPAAGGAADKAICTEAGEAGEAMRKTMITLMSANSGTIAPADAKAMFADFTTKVNAAITNAAESPVSTAAQAIADELTKIGAAADPMAAAESANFEKAGADFTAACKAAGVTVNF